MHTACHVHANAEQIPRMDWCNRTVRAYPAGVRRDVHIQIASPEVAKHAQAVVSRGIVERHDTHGNRRIRIPEQCDASRVWGNVHHIGIVAVKSHKLLAERCAKVRKHGLPRDDGAVVESGRKLQLEQSLATEYTVHGILN